MSLHSFRLGFSLSLGWFVWGCGSGDGGSERPESKEAATGEEEPDGSVADAAAAPAEDSSQAETPEVTALYDRDRVIEVVVELAADDWETIRNQGRSFGDIIGGLCADEPYAKPYTYAPADVVVDGTAMEGVGVRIKGFLGSLNLERPSLKLKFDEYDESQRFFGAERFTVNNNNQDEALVRTCLTYHVFEQAGLPAPRCNFAHVTVNGEDLGLYTHVEDMKKRFLRRHFSSDEGQLYEGTLADFTENASGLFEQKTNRETPYDRSDLAELTALLESDESDLETRLGAILNVDHFIEFWVLETVLSHWDGYTNNRNNYFVYNDPESGQFHFLPWGPDAAFTIPTDPFPGLDFTPETPLVFSKGLLSQRAYTDPGLRQKYFTALRQRLESWDEDALLAEIDRMEEVTQSYVDSGTEAAIEEVREFVRNHPANLLSLLDDSEPELMEPYDFCL